MEAIFIKEDSVLNLDFKFNGIYKFKIMKQKRFIDAPYRIYFKNNMFYGYYNFSENIFNEFFKIK